MRDDKGRYRRPDDKQISSEMEELLGLYLASLQEQKSSTSQSTVETRRREVRYWLAFCEANSIDPLAAETNDIRGYIQTNTNYADTTLDSYYRSIQSFYSIVANDQASAELELENGHPCRDKHDIDLKEDYNIHGSTPEYKLQHNLSGNDIDGVRESDQIIALKPETIHELFDHVPGETEYNKLRNEVAIRLAWYTGCRSEELSRLKIENITWDQCQIELRSAKLDPAENPDLIRRTVFFPNEFRLTLRRWVERERHSYSSAAEPESGRILVTTHNPEMRPAGISDIIKQAARNAGIQRPLRPADPGPGEEIKEWVVTSHRIRRSAISHWVNDCPEIDIHQARQMAGHAKIEQTMNYVEDDVEQIGDDYQRAMSKQR
ncbi:tyrosine-type recombinase/integrase [Haloarcula sp. GH36]|uniref:tyrosine-type recombinase/integrase n=1 Tax=Haloarcula montana TaxID=3111776 RepID=UPI002D77B71E|nr:site-specific integrase [Haloarcula sp. GH36]